VFIQNTQGLVYLYFCFFFSVRTVQLSQMTCPDMTSVSVTCDLDPKPVVEIYQQQIQLTPPRGWSGNVIFFVSCEKKDNIYKQ